MHTVLVYICRTNTRITPTVFTWMYDQQFGSSRRTRFASGKLVGICCSTCALCMNQHPPPSPRTHQKALALRWQITPCATSHCALLGAENGVIGILCFQFFSLHYYTDHKTWKQTTINANIRAVYYIIKKILCTEVGNEKCKLLQFRFCCLQPVKRPERWLSHRYGGGGGKFTTTERLRVYCCGWTVKGCRF